MPGTICNLAAVENSDRLRNPYITPAVETTFDGVRYVIAGVDAHEAVYVANREPFRHDIGRRAHARALLAFARILGVDTYRAGLIALWMAPNRCGLDWGGRVRILSREEEHAQMPAVIAARNARLLGGTR